MLRLQDGGFRARQKLVQGEIFAKVTPAAQPAHLAACTTHPSSSVARCHGWTRPPSCRDPSGAHRGSRGAAGRSAGAWSHVDETFTKMLLGATSALEVGPALPVGRLRWIVRVGITCEPRLRAHMTVPASSCSTTDTHAPIQHLHNPPYHLCTLRHCHSPWLAQPSSSWRWSPPQSVSVHAPNS